jgi:hypothetical protein
LNLLKIGLIVLFIATTALAQSPVNAESEDLYYKSLKIYLEENEKEYSKLFADRDFTKAIIVKDSFLPQNLPTSIGKYKIEFIDYDELRKRLKKETNKTLIVAEFRPLLNQGNKFVISIAEYHAKYERSKLSLGLSDGIRIIFRFDCGEEKFVFETFEFFGV